ncbi:MAG: hypothetical protein O9333_12790 [Beijerinckiaceae bacterium]|jgi:hypothetical protein|nr:hypothetical protein [Beijerinckiaceae bacterium]
MNSPRIALALLVGLAIILVFALLGVPKLGGSEVAGLAAGGLLLTMWASWFMAEMRGNMGETIRNLLIWGALITVVAIAYSYKTQFGF